MALERISVGLQNPRLGQDSVSTSNDPRSYDKKEVEVRDKCNAKWSFASDMSMEEKTKAMKSILPSWGKKQSCLYPRESSELKFSHKQ